MEGNRPRAEFSAAPLATDAGDTSQRGGIGRDALEELWTGARTKHNDILSWRPSDTVDRVPEGAAYATNGSAMGVSIVTSPATICPVNVALGPKIA